MKLLSAFAAMLLLAISLSAQVVNFPDAGLEGKVRDALSKPTGDITQTDMLSLTSLIADYASITDLTGLEFATNLQTLSLYSNDVTDLGPISGLTSLTAVYISFNPNLKDVSPLSGLTGLTDLSLDNNGIQDITPLVTLSNLSYLAINDNFINLLPGSDNSDALATITTNNPGIFILQDNQSVYIPDAALEALIRTAISKPTGDISYADMLGLTSLIADYASITDLTGLEFATNLQTLSLYSNDVTDLGPIAGLTSLTAVYISFNPNLKDVSPLSGLTGLTDLSLDNNGIEDITPLVTLSNLSYLAINDNFINLLLGSDNSDALATITTNNPGIFILQDNQSVYIPDAALEALIRTAISKPTGDISYADMLGFTQLFPNENGVTDLTGLEYASNLQLLSIFGEDIADLTPLEGLTSLTDLYIQNSASLVDISPLANMTWLENLGLDGNQITDISALISYTNLEYLSVTMNFLDLSLGSINSIDLATIAGNNPTASINATPQAVYIPDANLRARLLFLLGRSSGHITPTDMASFTGSVDLEDRGIVELTGLEYLVNATTLRFYNNSISDISPLKDLTNLEGLFLSNNSISDISPLKDLTNLIYLSLSNNSLSDIGPLKDLTNLGALYLDNISISDISPLKDLTNLIHISLSNNSLSDIGPLKDLTNLGALYLHINSLSDISPLKDLTNLQFLYLHSNSISDISALTALESLSELALVENYINLLPGSDGSTDLATITANNPTAIIVATSQYAYIPDANLYAHLLELLGESDGYLITPDDMASFTGYMDLSSLGILDLTGLEYLVNTTEFDLDANSISDISPLKDLTNLIFLSLDANSISDISPLKDLTKLEVLYLNNNSISDISSLQNLTNLGALSLDANSIIDISPLQNLTSLEYLSLGDNSISDISPLQNLTALHLLYLNGNSISDISSLQNLTKLRTLGLRGNDISDISSLQNLTSLIFLSLGDNSISDISPLQNLTALDLLYLNGNSISDISSLEYLTKLRTLGLRGNDISDISSLQSLTDLVHLDLISNSINDISPLQNLINLEFLQLSSNPISDISSLQNLTNLRNLDLHENALSDISALTTLSALSNLGITRNYINLLPGSDSSTDLATITDNNPTATITATQQYAYIPDAILYARLLELLGESDGYKIFQDDMTILTGTIDLNDGLGIATIEGLQFASAMDTLDLGDNPVRDLSPLTMNPTYDLTSITVGNPDALDWDLDHANVAAIEQLLDDGVDLNGLLVPVDAMQIRIEPAGNDLRITYGPYLGGRFFHRNFDLNNESGWHDIMLNGISEAPRPLEYSGTTTGPSSPEDSSFYRFSNTSKSILAE